MFGAEAYTATEGGAAARVSIHLSEPVDVEPLDVRLQLRYGGGATDADRRIPIPTVVRFAVGEQTKTIMVTATDDSDDDDGESVSLSFVNAPNDRLTTGNGPSTNDGGAGRQRRARGGGGVVRGGDLHGHGRRRRCDGARATGQGARARGDGAADGGEHLGGTTPADYSVQANVAFGTNETSKTFTRDRDGRRCNPTAARA